MSARDVVHFGTETLNLPGAIRRQTIAAVVRGAGLGAIGALLVDARTSHDLLRAHELLRALFDDPRQAKPVLHARRIVALVKRGDVQAAFVLGRYGIFEVVEDHEVAKLPARLRRMIETDPHTSLLTVPRFAAPRPAHLARREEGQPPAVAIGYRHAEETTALLERYKASLLAAGECSVFEDVATLIDVLIREGLSCQTNLATKAGATDTGQFIGSFEFYRQLRHSRYAELPDDPSGSVAMDVFIAVDEILHEVLHFLFLANDVRAGIPDPHTLVAEELSVSWWQAVIHQQVFPHWHSDHRILEINDDFLLDEGKAAERGFFRQGKVFDAIRHYTWVERVLGCLPQRAVYISERPDLGEVACVFSQRAKAAFLTGDPAHLRVTGPRVQTPSVPATFHVQGAGVHPPAATGTLG
jgi:hypothetical protein